jgi:folate-binding protein YgfZ
MSDPHGTSAQGFCALEDFGVLRFRGPDAVRFLQGQLSNDLAALTPAAILRAGLHNPQGRTVALLWLAADGPDDLLALLPRELAGSVAAQLKRYLLRAKLTIADESAQSLLVGVVGAHSGERQWRLDAGRAVRLQPAPQSLPAGERLSREQWRALDIAAGQPQVYAATSGQFVAQMLNLDCIDAVSFTKGCYTGQEVIARAHYRGRVKRRMQRFETAAAVRLAPGDAGRLEDGRAFRIVEAVTRAAGGSEFLAVAPLPGAAREPEAEAAREGADDAARGGAALRAQALSLPYALPE